jgi:hypothetical protein
MKEYSIVCNRRRQYITDSEGNRVLNPDRIDSYFVRGENKKDCVEIINTHTRINLSMHHFNNFALMWGTRVKYPEFDGRGLWVTRDFSSEDLIEIWIDKE